MFELPFVWCLISVEVTVVQLLLSSVRHKVTEPGHWSSNYRATQMYKCEHFEYHIYGSSRGTSETSSEKKKGYCVKCNDF